MASCCRRLIQPARIKSKNCHVPSYSSECTVKIRSIRHRGSPVKQRTAPQRCHRQDMSFQSLVARLNILTIRA